jgi:ABC-type amino acid transport substrate-binding protein
MQATDRRQTKRVVAVVTALVAGAALAAAVGACSLRSTSTSSPSAGGSRIEGVLGHTPTGLAAQILREGQIAVADDAAYPPQSYKDKSGQLVGFDVDVAKRVAQLLGVQVKFVNPIWESVPAGLKSHLFDVSIGSMTPEAGREAGGLSFADPYYYAQGEIVVKRGAPPLTTLESLKGKTIGVVVTSIYDTFLQTAGGAVIRAYDSDAEALRALAKGRLDGVMTADVTANLAIAAGRPLQLSGQPLFYQPECFAVRKGEADLLALLDYTVKKMRADGSLSALAKSWYQGFDPTQPPAAGVPEFTQAVAQLTGK